MAVEKNESASSFLSSLAAMTIAAVYVYYKSGLIESAVEVAAPLVIAFCFINVPFLFTRSAGKPGGVTSGKAFGTVHVPVALFAIFIVVGRIDGRALSAAIMVVAAVAGSAAFVVAAVRYFRSYPRAAIIIHLAVFMGLGVFTAGIAWGPHIHTVMFIEKIMLGRYHADTLFFSAIANMIKLHNVSTAGLDGVVAIPYHTVSNWIFAMFSNVTGIRVFSLYNILFPVFFFPLLLKTLLSFIDGLIASWGNGDTTVGHNTVKYLLILVGVAGFLPKHVYYANAYWDLLFVSESYLVSIIFSLVLFTMAVRLAKSIREGEAGPAVLVNFVLALALVYVIGGTKQSSLVLICPIAFWCFVRLGLYRRYRYALMFILLVVVAYCSYRVYRVPDVVGGLGESIAFLHYYRTYAKGSFIFFFILHNFWSLLYVGMRLFHEARVTGNGAWPALMDSIRSGKTLDCEVVAILMVLGTLPGMFFALPTTSAFFFLNFQHMVSLGLVIAYVYHHRFRSDLPSPDDITVENLVAHKGRFAYLATTVAALLILMGINNAYNNILVSYYTTKMDVEKTLTEMRGHGEFLSPGALVARSFQGMKIADIPSLPGRLMRGNMRSLEKLPHYGTVKDLLSLEKVDAGLKRESALYIPRSNGYWDVMESPQVSFLAPALSGLPLLFGTPAMDEWDSGNMFSIKAYQLLSRAALEALTLEDVLSHAKKKGFTKVFFYEKESNIRTYDLEDAER